MNTTISAMPPAWAAVAYGVLVLGVVFVVGFITDYLVHTSHIDEIGRHMIAMSANVGAFFVLYLALALWPQFPGRNLVRFVLLIAIVANSGWRWYLYRKTIREALTNPPRNCPLCGALLERRQPEGGDRGTNA